jgi:hypothetical protein
MTIMAQSNQKQVEALSEISDIIAQIPYEDLERMELLAQEISTFDRGIGGDILEAHNLLIQLNDAIESALERLEPDIEEDEEDIEEDEDEEDIDETMVESDDLDDEDEEQDDQGRSKRVR